jgi:hypothetical protein
MTSRWDVWKLDPPTWAWIGWLVAFVVIEAWTLAARNGQELTAHLRAIFLAFPLAWFLAIALWLWVGLHLLAPRWEWTLLRVVR